DGDYRWSVERDFMTMQMVGFVQEVPNRGKRRARAELAQATVERAEAGRKLELLNVRRATAQAWLVTHTVERKLALMPELLRENRLLSDVVRAQFTGGLGSAVEALAPRQEAMLLAERQDELIRWRQ